MGMGIGMVMGQAGPWGQMASPQAAQATPPPPPPTETAWHIAANGATTGPFGASSLPTKLADGSLTRDTLVWTAGQDGWKKAGEVLAALFAAVPPPPPPPGM